MGSVLHLLLYSIRYKSGDLLNVIVEVKDHNAIVPLLYFYHKHGYFVDKVFYGVIVYDVTEKEVRDKDSRFWLSTKAGTRNFKDIYTIRRTKI